MKFRFLALASSLCLLTAACSGGDPSSVGPSPVSSTDFVPGESSPGAASPTGTGGVVPTVGGTSGTGGTGGQGSDGGSGDGSGGDSGGDGEPYKGEVGVTDDTITLGWIYPRSGPYQALARNVGPAVQAAFNIVNENGGIHGRDLHLLTADDGYNNASTALASAAGMEDQVLGMTTFGLLAGTVIAPWADERDIPVIVGNLDRATGKKLRSVFTPTTYLETQAEILPSFIKNYLKQGSKDIGVIYQTTPQIAIVRESFRAKARALGLKIVIEQPVPETPSQCTNEVTNVQNAGAELVILFTAPVPAVCVLRDAEVIGFNPIWTGVGGTMTFNITNTASGGLTEGFTFLSNLRTLETAEGQRYQAAMRKYYPNNSDAPDDDLAYVTWGQAHIWIEALKRAGPELTREGFVKAMETFRGWDGGQFAPMTFKAGDRSGPRATIVIRAVNQRWTTIERKWRSTYK